VDRILQSSWERPTFQRAFSEALQRHGLVKRKGAKGVHMFVGVRLRPKPDIRQAKEARDEFG